MRVSSLITVLATASLLGACFSSNPKEEHFYSLKGPAGPSKGGEGLRLLVSDFSAAAGYETERLAYRLSDHEVRYYGYHKWTSDPARMLTEMVAQHIRVSGKFAEVGRNDKMRVPDIILEGVVEAIEEIDLGKTWKAHLAMRFTLRQGDSERIIMWHSFDLTEGCKERHPREVARGINKILSGQVKALVDEIVKKSSNARSYSTEVKQPEAPAPEPEKSGDEDKQK